MSKVSKGCICAFERVVTFKYAFLLKNTYLENVTYKTNTQSDKYIPVFKNLWLTLPIWNLTKVDMFVRETKKNKTQG